MGQHRPTLDEPRPSLTTAGPSWSRMASLGRGEAHETHRAVELRFSRFPRDRRGRCPKHRACGSSGGGRADAAGRARKPGMRRLVPC